MTLSVVHLVDDATAGGVNRMLEFMTANRALADVATQSVVRVKRGQLSPPMLSADLIVSHLSVCWINVPLFTALRARHPSTPMVHVEHSYSERFTALFVANRDRFHSLLRSTYALFDRVVAVGAAQAAWLGRWNLCAPGTLVRIAPCVDLAAHAALRGEAPGTPTVVGAIGRLAPQKGFDILVRAFQSPLLEGMTLNIYGDGPERGRLEELASGLPNVVLKGFASDPAAAVAECDIVAMPSRWEPYGLVALEAMAAGRPVLATSSDGLAEHVRNGAIKVADNSAESWMEALLLLTPEEIRNASRRGAIAADRAAATFVGSWRALIETLAAGRGSDLLAAA